MNVANLPNEARSHRPAGHPPALAGRVGVLIVNLGTPEGTDYWSIRRYLQEFLSDRRVIETPRVIWAPILQAILLRRPHAKGRDYDAIWNKERDEGPLKTITRAQSEKLAAALRDLDKDVVVDWAMRYGAPPIAERLKALQAEGCDRILVVPLYPQYCAASTATVGDKAFEALQSMRWQPAIRIAAPYYDDPVYIEALARSVRASLADLDFEPEVLVASYHGIPQAYFDKGDPYFCHCAKTTRLLREAMGMNEKRLHMTFQSRFGRGEWLKPDTSADLARTRVQRRQARGGLNARFRRGLPRDAGGNRRRERRLFPRGRRRAFRRDPVPQRQRRRHGGDRSPRPAGAQGLGGVGHSLLPRGEGGRRSRPDEGGARTLTPNPSPPRAFGRTPVSRRAIGEGRSLGDKVLSSYK